MRIEPSVAPTSHGLHMGLDDQLITLWLFVVQQILLNLIIGILLMVVWQEMNIYQNKFEKSQQS